PAHVAEELADLVLAGRQAPLGEVDLRVAGEQVQDAAAVRGHAPVVEGLEVLDRHALALLVGHGGLGDPHGWVPSRHGAVGTRSSTLACIQARNASRSRLTASHAA